MISAFLPVFFIFAFGFLISKLIHSLREFDLAERIAIWFGIGLLIVILNSLFLGLTNLLSILLPISGIELIVLISILLIKEKIKQKISPPEVIFVLLAILMCLSLYLASSSTVDFIRNPDEYKNALWAKTMMETSILSPGSLGRLGIDWFPANSILESWVWLQKYAYGLSQVYFFQVGGFSLLTGQVLSALFYSMLILATFLLGSIRSKKTGLIAAIFIAFNPMIFVFSNHLMTDIPVATLATLSLYFFIKSYTTECINERFFFIALIFTGLVTFTKPTAFFIYPLISFYALHKRMLRSKKIELLGRLLPLLIFLTVFVVDGVRAYLIQHPNPSWNIFIDASAPFAFSINDWTDYLFTSPKGAYGTFIFPYLYTYGILLLILLGILDIWVKERNSLNLTLLGICIFTLWIFTTSTLIGGTVRRIFIIFPIIMYFAAIGLQSRNFLTLLLVPFFLLLINIPEQGYVPYVQYTILPEAFRLIIKLAGAAVVCLKITEWLLQKNIFRTHRIKIKVRVRRAIKQHIPKLEFSDILMITILLVTISASLFSGYFYKNNGPQEINETITIESVSIKQAVAWIDANIPSGSKIATNIIFEFPFYLSYLSPKNYTIINIPGTYAYSQEEAHDAFLNLTLNAETEYLIILTSMGYWHWYPYLEDYLDNPPPRMYEIHRSDTFVIYKVS